jgi:hypothetical protein
VFALGEERSRQFTLVGDERSKRREVAKENGWGGSPPRTIPADARRGADVAHFRVSWPSKHRTETPGIEP